MREQLDGDQQWEKVAAKDTHVNKSSRQDDAGTELL
jgi:hypothetical protein